MASRNQLLRQIKREQTDEEKLAEMHTLQRGRLHLDMKQQRRLEELEVWYEQYKKDQMPGFRKWAFHPVKGGKVFSDEDEWNSAIAGGWYDALHKANAAKSAEGRQREIEKEWSEPEEKDEEFNETEYLVYLRRIISKGTTEKQLYHYSRPEMVEVFKKLRLDFDESWGHTEMYRKLKSYIEMNT